MYLLRTRKEKPLQHLRDDLFFRHSLDLNPLIVAFANMGRDGARASKLGATRSDIQNARRIIGERLG
jgi:hypothetical protein